MNHSGIIYMNLVLQGFRPPGISPPPGEILSDLALPRARSLGLWPRRGEITGGGGRNPWDTELAVPGQDANLGQPFSSQTSVSVYMSPPSDPGWQPSRGHVNGPY